MISRPKIRMAIFASGAGSNAARLIEHFRNHPGAVIDLLISSNPAAGVNAVARTAGIPLVIPEPGELSDSGYLTGLLRSHRIDLVILAGYLKLLPAGFVKNFENRIINIHPSLLPKYGGKGMYGHRVHQAVIDAGEKETGITIHLVNEHYDKGRILRQFTCPVLEHDDAPALAGRVHELEHREFPVVVEEYIKSL